MKISLLLLALLGLSACVSSGPQSQLGREKPRRIEMSRTSDCVFQSTVSGFEAIDDRYVVLFGMGRRKAYLAEIAAGCFDVSNQFSLASVDGDGNGQICGYGRDSFAYQRLGMVENCRILALEDLSEERRLELGVGAPPKKQKKEEEEDEEENDEDKAKNSK